MNTKNYIKHPISRLRERKMLQLQDWLTALCSVDLRDTSIYMPVKSIASKQVSDYPFFKRKYIQIRNTIAYTHFNRLIKNPLGNAGNNNYLSSSLSDIINVSSSAFKIQEINSLLLNLDNQEKLPFLLNIAGYDISEIADITKLNEKEVTIRIHRILKVINCKEN